VRFIGGGKGKVSSRRDTKEGDLVRKRRSHERGSLTVKKGRGEETVKENTIDYLLKRRN